MGVDARGFPGGLLRLDPAFVYVEPPSFATGGVPHSGPQQTSDYVHMPVHLGVCVCVCVHECVPGDMFMSVCIPGCVCKCEHVPGGVCVHVSVYLGVCTCLHSSVCLSTSSVSV